MASIVLSVAGSFAGAATGVPGGAGIGSALGRMAGGFIDQKIFGGGKGATREGLRLTELGVETSTYGKMVPIVYGRMRIAGNIIWSQPIRETATTTTSTAGGGGKGGGGRVSQTSTTYSYSVSLAAAVCEGAVDEVLRIWADAKLLNLSQYQVRVYKGTEEQLPDALIEAVEGDAPAYRGMAYVVFEDFPLADFGNRIPNFTFEVQKKAQFPDYNGQVVENTVTGMIIIPGAGEFVYGTQVREKIPGEAAGAEWAQTGNRVTLNMHNAEGRANVLLAIDQLQATCPNVTDVGVVVCWFGDSLDAGVCTVMPGVEYQAGAATSPDTWGVAGYDRDSARQITIEDGSPRYGGTPSDATVVELCQELKVRGYNVMFYPMLFMDVDGKPWRGQMTGSAANVASFFTKTNGYNHFINHYAGLMAGKVDAFVIGSEMKGLTAVTDTPGNYPAVNQLVSLSTMVKAALGSGVTVTYAADWSEYHHTDGGYYNLDPLWACSAIDVVGIDAYFPLTNAPQSDYDVGEVKAGWVSGEGYDFYYSDPERTIEAPLSAAYAWKNIAWWWGNTHYNPGGVATAWVPESKKIWFTEYGFPSVDGAANEPNVFFDPASTVGGLPRFSKGRVDLRAQRAGIAATTAQWAGSSMVEKMFLWTWDARPYPYFPDLRQVWGDGPNWKYGHWVTGKFGVSSLAAIVADLCERAGLEAENYDVTRITDPVEGFALTTPGSVRSAIEQLMRAYFFDPVESGQVMKFVPRGGVSVLEVHGDALVPMEGKHLSLTRTQELDLPRRVNTLYMNRLLNYQTATQYAERMVTGALGKVTLELPIVMSDQMAKSVAEIALFSAWAGRTQFSFSLPPRYAALEPADVIAVEVNGVQHVMRVLSTRLEAPGAIRVSAVSEDVSAYDYYTPPGEGITATQPEAPYAVTALHMLDIAALPGDKVESGVMRYAACGLSSPWNGAVLYRSDDGGGTYARQADFNNPSVMGVALDALPSGVTCVFDEAHRLNVSLLGAGELASATELAVLNGANAALVGDEIIQFKSAVLLAPGKYQLSGLLRGRQGTEWAMASHAAGERFVLLSGSVTRQDVPQSLFGLSRLYKPVSVGGTLGETEVQSFAYMARALKPYAPVHVAASRDGSGNITFTWARRARVSGEWQDGVDVPLNESSEAYEVEIMDGVDVVRRITGLVAPFAAYSALEQVGDFGSLQNPLSIRVYQLSDRVGKGYAASATL